MASDVLRSVNRILQYQQERESRKVQESLALMQFGIQKRQADIKEYSMQMETIDKSNKQFKLNIADNFIQNSGLESIMNVIPSGITDAGEATESLAEITKLLTKKQYGKFNKQNASNIANALWVYKNAEEPSSVVNLANNIELMYSKDFKGTESNRNLLESFGKISNISQLRNVSKQAKQSLQNDANILKEQYEFGQGDTKIQSSFGMFAPEVVNQFKQQQLKDDKLDISSITDLVEKEIEDPTEEVSGEKIYRQGYESLTNQEIVDKAQDFLTVEETSQAKVKLENLSGQQIELQNALTKLVDERDDLLTDYDDMVEDKENQLKRYKYFKRSGDIEKANEAAKSVNRLESMLRKDYFRTNNPSIAEKTAFDRVSFHGERQADTFEGTKTLEIVNLKRAIRELERQRQRMTD